MKKGLQAPFPIPGSESILDLYDSIKSPFVNYRFGTLDVGSTYSVVEDFLHDGDIDG